jgi:hypothetical protein
VSSTYLYRHSTIIETGAGKSTTDYAIEQSLELLGVPGATYAVLADLKGY